MTKIKANDIFKKATEIKAYVEKNKKLPLTVKIGDVNHSIYSISYLMGALITNKYVIRDYDTIGVTRYNAQTHTDTINAEKVQKNDYFSMLNHFMTYCRQNKRVPAYITTSKSKTKVSFELFTYCLAKIVVFYQKNKTNPNYCIMDKNDLKQVKPKTNCENPYTSSPHLLATKQGQGQKYPYDCSAFAVREMLYKLTRIKISEDTLIKVGGVTTAGVGHEGINTMIAWFNRKYGYKLKVEWKYFSDLGDNANARFKKFGELICKSNVGVVTHIGYAHAGERKISKGDDVIGHYEGLDKVNTKTKYVRALNSLGKKINSHAYAGHLQDRPYEVQASFFANTPANQKALCIITK